MSSSRTSAAVEQNPDLLMGQAPPGPTGPEEVQCERGVVLFCGSAVSGLVVLSGSVGAADENIWLLFAEQQDEKWPNEHTLIRIHNLTRRF